MTGLNPQSALEVNNQVGTTLREFATLREKLARHQKFMLATNLKTLTGWPGNPAPGADPATPEEIQAGVDAETALKSAIGSVDTLLAAFDMTFVDRVTGLW